MKEIRDKVERIIVKRVNKDGYIYWKNGMVMVDDILSLINQEVIKGRIDEFHLGEVLSDYGRDERFKELQEELKKVTPKERG